MRIAIILSTAGLLIALVSGCGSAADQDGSTNIANEGDGNYCSTLRTRAELVKSFTAADEPDFSTFDDFVAAAERLESQAPADLTDDWASLVDSLHGFQVGLKEQGLTAAEYGRLVDDFDNLSDPDSDKVTAVISKMGALSSDKVGAAIRTVVQQAKSKCDVDLTSGD